MTLEKMIAEISGGNPGAMRVCCELVTYIDDAAASALVLTMLKDLKLTGPEIWMLYKDECDSDIKKFGRAVIEKKADSLTKE